MKSTSSLSQQIAAAQTAINNATEQRTIQKKLNAYGFNAKRMQEGKALLNQAILLQHEKNNCYGEKQELARELRTQLQETRQAFSHHVATVRLAFRNDPSTLAKFQVNRVATKQNEWQAQARYFYTKAAGYAEVLAGYQLPQSELAQNQASVEALMALRNRRLQLKGEAEEATRTRDLGMQALRRWMREFYSIARLALQDSPQLLEALGVPVKAERVP